MPSKTNYFDVIIIGGGPAGISAAITCAEIGINAILLEREAELGGQLLWTYNQIENYPPFQAKNGRELRDHFLQKVENTQVSYRTGAEVARVDLTEKIVFLENDDRYSARSIILATGVRRRKLNVPGEEEFCTKGILESGVKDKESVRGKTVVIVGGGDAALENACILSEVAKKIFIIHRRDHFTAQRKFIEMARQSQNIEFVFKSLVTEIIGDELVKSVLIENLVSREQQTLTTDSVLIRIGVVPNTELFANQIGMDDAGFVVTTNDLQTNVLAVYAAGDVANSHDLTVDNAARSGTESAKRTKI